MAEQTYFNIDSPSKTTTVGGKKVKVVIFGVILTILVALAVFLLVFILVLKEDDNSDHNDPYDSLLAESMNISRIRSHLDNLYDIALLHNGSRAVSLGFNASCDYVFDVLTSECGDFYNISTQVFTYKGTRDIFSPILSVLAPFSLHLSSGSDFLLMRGGGGFEGNVNLTRTVSVANGLGCVSDDWGSVVNGSFALVKRGNCTFTEKINFAFQAGAVLVMIFNDGGEGHSSAFNGNVGEIKLPAFGLSHTFGTLLGEVAASAEGLTMNTAVGEESYTIWTRNVLAETILPGKQANILVSGSHLDSVEAGAGINDNGSGSSVNLELAIQLKQIADHVELKNTVIFAWWGAEEVGLKGSYAWVDYLNATNPTRFSKVAANLNFDMIGSPNYFTGVYDGASANNKAVSNQSAQIQELFSGWFDQEGVPWNLTSFDDRSDYAPFTKAGIPAGGLFTGAEVPKSVEMFDLFGGIRNAPFDPCYHQKCDDNRNYNPTELLNNARAAGYVLQTLFEKEDVPAFLLQ